MWLTQLNRKPLWIIFIIGIVLYFPTLFNGFVWDDEEQIVNNPQIQSLSNLPAFFSGSTFNSGGGKNLSGLYYRPLMTSAFTLVNSIFGLNPLFFHLAQIILHIANAVLLYLILFYIFKKTGIDTRVSLFGSLLFLVHPISVEAVSYLSAYQEVIFFFFGALAFFFILVSGNSKKVFWSTFLILFSLLAKETGIVFAFIILVYLVCFEKEKIKVYLTSVGIVLGTYCFFRFAIAQVFFNKHGLTPISTMDLGHRLINIPKIVLTYLVNFVWPVNLSISQQWVVERINFGEFWMPLFVVLVFFFFLSISGFWIWKKRNKLFPLWLFFLLWFLAALSFHLQIFPLDLTVSDRWFYLALAGLSGLAAVMVGPIKIFRKMIWLSAGLLLILSTRTFVRELDWRDGLTLYGHDIKNSQNSFDLENNYGVELFRTGDFSDAKTHFERSTQLSPKWWTNWNNLGAVYEREGDLIKAQEYYRKAIDNGQYYLAYENYAGLLIRRGEKTQAKEFLEKEALRYFPNNVHLRQMLYLLYNDTQ